MNVKGYCFREGISDIEMEKWENDRGANVEAYHMHVYAFTKMA
jgi:hypothetical protein